MESAKLQVWFDNSDCGLIQHRLRINYFICGLGRHSMCSFIDLDEELG